MFKDLLTRFTRSSVGRTSPNRCGSKLGVEFLESRITPSVASDFYDVFTTDPVEGLRAISSGVAEGTVNVTIGAGDAIVETVRVAGDIVLIGTTDRGHFNPLRTVQFLANPLQAIWTTREDQIDPSLLNSHLFAGAAQTAGNPTAAASYDNQLLFGISTLGVGPLAVSGYNAAESGNSTEFSQQSGGFGVMVLVPYAGLRGIGYLRVPVTAATADGIAGAEGGVRAGGAVAEPTRLPGIPEPIRGPSGAPSEPIRIPMTQPEVMSSPPSVLSGSLKNPPIGEPNTIAVLKNVDGTIKQIRLYGPDGKPAVDVDFGHGHELGPNGVPVGEPHVHDWVPNGDGQFPTRGPARPPMPSDPTSGDAP